MFVQESNPIVSVSLCQHLCSASIHALQHARTNITKPTVKHHISKPAIYRRNITKQRGPAQQRGSHRWVATVQQQMTEPPTKALTTDASSWSTAALQDLRATNEHHRETGEANGKAKPWLNPRRSCPSTMPRLSMAYKNPEQSTDSSSHLKCDTSRLVCTRAS